MGTAKNKGKSAQEKKPEEETQDFGNEEKLAKKYPFHGYDVGDDLIHVSGKSCYMFPKDGGLIKVETTRFLQSCRSVRTSVYKDDHSLVMHLINPVNAMEIEHPVEEDTDALEKTEANQKGMFFTCFSCAVLSLWYLR